MSKYHQDIFEQGCLAWHLLFKNFLTIKRDLRINVDVLGVSIVVRLMHMYMYMWSKATQSPDYICSNIDLLTQRSSSIPIVVWV